MGRSSLLPSVAVTIRYQSTGVVISWGPHRLASVAGLLGIGAPPPPVVPENMGASHAGGVVALTHNIGEKSDSSPGFSNNPPPILLMGLRESCTHPYIAIRVLQTLGKWAPGGETAIDLRYPYTNHKFNNMQYMY